MTTKTSNRKRSAYDLSHVKSVRAFAILLNGEPVGKLVANFSDNPNGSVCTATLSIWKGPLANLEKTTATAGGYGYDKLTSCMTQIVDGFYEGDVNEGFKRLGYETFSVC